MSIRNRSTTWIKNGRKFRPRPGLAARHAHVPDIVLMGNMICGSTFNMEGS
jgi:hypothetical protein